VSVVVVVVAVVVRVALAAVTVAVLIFYGFSPNDIKSVFGLALSTPQTRQVAAFCVRLCFYYRDLES
jgi:hypothetical protein